MKTSRFFLLVGLVIVVAAVSLGYSARITTRVRNMEQQLQRAEAALQSHNQSLADTTIATHLRSLEKRLGKAELAASQPHIAGGGSPAGLDERIQNVERKIEPHLETLPPYNPYK